MHSLKLVDYLLIAVDTVSHSITITFCIVNFYLQNKLLEEGQEYAVMMYTWRCCSRALPQVTDLI